MKKPILIVLTFLLLGTAAVYVFIPSTITVSETAAIRCVADAAIRKLTDKTSWPGWWPGKIETAPDGTALYQLNNTVYTVSQRMLHTLALQIKHNGDTVGSHLSVLNLPGDSAIIKWECRLEAGKNPFQRIKTYREAIALKKNMDSVTAALQHYLSSFENVYGVAFREASTADTVLISTRAVSPVYPSTAFVYGMVDKLRDFCKNSKCTITGPPMLNVTALDTGRFQVMVALPVEHSVAGNGDIQLQKMIPGRFIIADVKGGPHAIENTHRQLLHFFQDYHRTAMAIPFEYLITDRVKESDTSKWVTRIYSPVY